MSRWSVILPQALFHPQIKSFMKKPRTAIIIGAGPAGLTAALELLERTDIVPIIIEQSSEYVGGISKTVVYKGNRIDIGGHRFFSKSDRVMSWWLNILPLEHKTGSKKITYHNQSRDIDTQSKTVDPDSTDEVMLVRNRISRIYYNKSFFDYPITLSLKTLSKLGFKKVVKMGISYAYRMVRPLKPEENLEAFFTNRFGDELYKTFFKSYTEKVWGAPCNSISAEWGAQRVKGLSILKAIIHPIKKLISKSKNLAQKGTETSLIESFLYPKFGPGHLWETVAKKIKEKGGEIIMGLRVVKIHNSTQGKITGVTTVDREGNERFFGGHMFFSTMAIKDFISSLEKKAPKDVREVAQGLQYRDFVTVGLLINDTDEHAIGELSDNWIYVHDEGVRVGRVQIFNNWSPYLVAEKGKRWIGLEYFCNEGDAFWSMKDEDILSLAKREIVQIGLVSNEVVDDGVVLREKKTYPAYFGTYNRFYIVRNYLQSLSNLYPLGRNGMHRYNNQDHSMLTAMMSVDSIVSGKDMTSQIWSVNTEDEYHEEKK